MAVVVVVVWMILVSSSNPNAKTNYYGKIILGLQEIVSGPHIPVFLGWTLKNTDTLAKFHVQYSEGFLGYFSVSLGSQIGFWRIQSVFSGRSCSSELGPKIIDHCYFFVKDNNVPGTGNVDKQSNYDSGETENYPRKMSGNSGEHPGVYRCFFTVPSSKTRILVLTSQFLEPKSVSDDSCLTLPLKPHTKTNIL